MFFYFRENLFQFILIFILLIILAYTANITSIPNSIILFQNEDIDLQTIAGIKVEEEIETEDEQTIYVGADLVSARASTRFTSTKNI